MLCFLAAAKKGLRTATAASKTDLETVSFLPPGNKQTLIRYNTKKKKKATWSRFILAFIRWRTKRRLLAITFFLPLFFPRKRDGLQALLVSISDEIEETFSPHLQRFFFSFALPAFLSAFASKVCRRPLSKIVSAAGAAVISGSVVCRRHSDRFPFISFPSFSL